MCAQTQKHAHTQGRRADSRVIEVTQPVCEPLLFTTLLSHSLDAVACYIIVMSDERLISEAHLL